MKILFIENRYKTAYWQDIGAYLNEHYGHSIHWIVQNQAFVPDLGEVHIMPYPPRNYKASSTDISNRIKKIKKADRGLNYFSVPSADHLYYYEEKMTSLIESISPDLVIGECTLFHELLAIDICREKGTLFLHPTSCRYPPGRFSFYMYDTLTPYGTNQENCDYQEAQILKDGIVNRTLQIDYMSKPKPISKMKKIKDKATIIKERWRGERYNTPSVQTKLSLEKKKEQLIERWESLAKPNLEHVEQTFKVLFPLQLQPEANVDVWGYPNNDQTAAVRQIIDHLSDGDCLIVKPNPKSKYEISEEMLRLIGTHENVTALVHDSKMGDIFDEIDLIVTVTGTVAIEAVLASKPVYMTGKAIISETKGCYHKEDLTDLSQVIESIKDGSYVEAVEADKVGYVQRVMNTSFKGIHGDSLHSRHHLDNKENMQYIYDAFVEVIDQIKRDGTGD